MTALLAALAIAVSVHPGYGGTCVDVTVDGVTTRDAVCPPRLDLVPRSFTAKGRTIWFGALQHKARRVVLTFPHRTVRARVTRQRGWAAAGDPVLGAIAVGGRARDVDPFGLPSVGRRVSLLTLTDEQDRHPRLVAASPRVLQGSRRRKALCTGLQLPGTPSPGRQICVVNPLVLDVRFSAECKARKQLVYGVGPSFIRSARATLSDGSTAPLTVTRIPGAVRRPGVALTASFTGALAKRVAVYDGSGARVAAASLSGGC